MASGGSTCASAAESYWGAWYISMSVFGGHSYAVGQQVQLRADINIVQADIDIRRCAPFRLGGSTKPSVCTFKRSISRTGHTKTGKTGPGG